MARKQTKWNSNENKLPCSRIANGCFCSQPACVRLRQDCRYFHRHSRWHGKLYRLGRNGEQRFRRSVSWSWVPPTRRVYKSKDGVLTRVIDKNTPVPGAPTSGTPAPHEPKRRTEKIGTERIDTDGNQVCISNPFSNPLERPSLRSYGANDGNESPLTRTSSLGFRGLIGNY